MTPARVTLVTLGVADVSRSVAFYAALGWETARQSVESTAFMTGAGGPVLALWQRDEMIADGGEGALAEGSGSVGFAVNFASETAVEAAYRTAVEAGARPVKPPARVFWGGFSGNFRDPDGHLWEFAHNPFFALDERGQLDLSREPEA